MPSLHSQPYVVKVAVRYTKNHKEEVRRKIVEAASTILRKRGTAVSIHDLMREVGLTHGGFYGHFKSRDDLMNQAFESAISQTESRWRKGLRRSSNPPLRPIVKDYLSPGHRDRPETGCPLPLFAIDAAQGNKDARRVFAQGLESHIALVEEASAGSDRRDVRQGAAATVAMLVGAILLARATEGEPISDELLQAASKVLLKSPQEG